MINWSPSGAVSSLQPQRMRDQVELQAISRRRPQILRRRQAWSSPQSGKHSKRRLHQSHSLQRRKQKASGPVVRGVTDTEIVFGMSAPFSGAAKELGQNMKLGIEAAFNAANASGGVNGRRLRLVAADDGYEPTRTAETMKRLYEKDQVFGVIGNVGTPTATVALPYALERKMLFFGAFTGAGLLRSDPPDRYVFNYRASYAEETDAVVHYLVKVRHLKTDSDRCLCSARLHTATPVSPALPKLSAR